MSRLKKILTPASIIFYNLLPLAWVFFYNDSPWELAYFYILETAVIGICAFLLLLAKAGERIWVLPLAVTLLAGFACTDYLFLYLVNGFSALEQEAHGAPFYEPLQLFHEVYRPNSVWIFLAMFIGPGFNFMRLHMKRGIDPVAVAGHAFQRMMMLSFMDAASGGFVMWLQSVKGVAVGIVLVKTLWDLWESSSKFDPKNLFGIPPEAYWRSRTWH